MLVAVSLFVRLLTHSQPRSAFSFVTQFTISPFLLLVSDATQAFFFIRYHHHVGNAKVLESIFVGLKGILQTCKPFLLKWSIHTKPS